MLSVERANELKFIAKTIYSEIKLDLTITMKKQKYPNKIRGDALASELLEIKRATLRKRVQNGFYLDGVDFKQESARIRIWDTSALLDRWRKENETL